MFEGALSATVDEETMLGRALRAPAFSAFWAAWSFRGWFGGWRVVVRASRPQDVVLTRRLATCPSAPAFWAAGTHWRPSDPASHHRRGR